MNIRHTLIFLILVISTYKMSHIKRRNSNVKTFLFPDDSSSKLRLTKEKLGRYSWNILHTIAASYPKNPNEEDKIAIKNFVDSFSYLYPCNECKKHFQKMIDENVIKSNSREELVQYFCDLHNIVNKRLEKPIFDCKEALNYWGGSCGCNKGK